METDIPEHKHLNESGSLQSNSLGNLHSQSNNSIVAPKSPHLEFPSENMEYPHWKILIFEGHFYVFIKLV